MSSEPDSRSFAALARLRAGIVDLDVERGTIELDGRAQRLLGTESARLTHAELLALLDPEHRPETEAQLGHALAESPSRDVYLAIAAREGTRWLCLRFGTEPASGRLRSATLLDVTLHEQDRRALWRQLRHNESFARLAARLLEAPTLEDCVAATSEEVVPPLGMDKATIELFGEGDRAVRAETERIMMQWGEVAYFPDVTHVKRDPLRQAIAEPRLRTLVTSPIIVEGVLLGVISVGSLGVTRFLVDDDLAFFGSVVALASGAIAAKRLAAANREMEAKLAQSQKMESLGMLAGGIAHDFNNLLVGILGNASLALSALPDDAPGRGELRSLRLAALRASDLTKQLLAYAGRATFNVTKVDVREIVDEMRALLGAAIPKNVIVNYDFTDDPTFVEADVTQLRQVFMNLLTNASDAIGKSEGTIAVTVRRVKVATSYFADALFGEENAGGAYVAVTVTDSGAGMSPEVRSRIFDPFFTTKSSGRGLGLAAVLGILRTHHGTIKVRSEVGKGTSFEVLLPALEFAPEEATVTRSDAPEPMRGSGTVLVIDDEPVVRAVAQRALERVGFRVLLAEDGIEGLATFAANSKDVAVVLLDASMPRMGGVEALEKLRELDAEVPIIISSGYSPQELMVERDHVAFLPKPFEPRQLVSAVFAVLRAARAREG